MFKKIVCITLILGLANLVCFSQVSNVKTTADSATRIKEAVNKIGINHKVSIKLLNGNKINGFIKEIKSDSFIIVDGYKIVNNDVVAVDKANSAVEIQLSQVKEIKGKGIGPGGKAIGVAVIVALGVVSFVAFVFLFGRRN